MVNGVHYWKLLYFLLVYIFILLNKYLIYPSMYAYSYDDDGDDDDDDDDNVWNCYIFKKASGIYCEDMMVIIV